MNTDDDDIRLTPRALARRWKITSHTLSQWRWNGCGPKFFKVGRRISYKLQDIKAFEEERSYENTSQIKHEKK
jgi:hypothetical protein